MSATNETVVTSSNGTGGTVAASADWSTSLVRYFLLDPVGGNDANVGYVDATAGSTIVPTGLAKATIAGLMPIIPPVLNTRRAVVLQMPGTLTENINIAGLTGSAFFMWRGSTDLTNTTSDRITCGFQIAVAGPGGSSEYTSDAGATTTTVPIAVGSFGAEPGALQYRVRFLPTTTTSALRNICRTITAHTTTVLTLNSALPGTPAAGDVFVIEKPGAIVAKIRWETSGMAAGTGDFSVFSTAQLVGIGYTGSTLDSCSVSDGSVGIYGVEGTASTTNITAIFHDGSFLTIGGAYADETGASFPSIGMGFRTLAPIQITRWTRAVVAQLGLMHATTASTLSNIPNAAIGSASYFAKGPTGASLGGPGNDGNLNNSVLIGTNSTSVALTRVNAGQLLLNSCSAAVRRVDLQNLGANAAIKAVGFGCVISVDGCTGSTGNTDVGIDVASSVGSKIFLGRTIANTVTGTAGDIRLSGPVITTHVSLTTLNVVDSNGNSILGTAAIVNEQCMQFTNGDGTAHALGEIVRVSATNTVIRAQNDTAAHATGPLWAAVTVPAASAAGYYVSMGAPQKWVLHDGTPTLGALSYISGTAGSNTTTIPVAGAGPVQKRRCGLVSKVSSTLGLVTGLVENITVDADSAL